MTTDTMDGFRSELAQRAMQACYRAVYPTEDVEPTPASLRFIDCVIDVARDASLPIGRRIERLENLLAHYLRMHASAAPGTGSRPVLKTV